MNAIAKPPITLPAGRWIGLDYPNRIPPLTRPRLWQRLFLAAIRIGAGCIVGVVTNGNSGVAEAGAVNANAPIASAPSANR